MALDPSIYSQVGKVNLGGGIADALANYTAQRAAQEDRQNKLSQMAQEQEMQGYQMRGLQRAEQAAPEQKAEAARQAQIKHTQELNLGVSQMIRQGVPKDQIIAQATKDAQTRGIDPNLTQQHLRQAFGSGKNDDELANTFEQAAYPEMVAKQRFEQQFAEKKQTPSALSTLQSERAAIVAANPNDPRISSYDQMIEKTTTSAPQMQIVTGASGDMSQVIMPKAGGKPTVQPLGIKAQPKQESLVQVQQPDGQIVYMTKTQAAGKAAPVKGVSGVKTTQHIEDAKESNALLDQVEKYGSKATGSGLGSLRDAAGNLIGISTGASQAAAQMKVLGASLTAKVPKMSGPQSDKDVALYKEAAGNISDPSTPWGTKKASIEVIREINNRQIKYNQPSVNKDVHSEADAILGL